LGGKGVGDGLQTPGLHVLGGVDRHHAGGASHSVEFHAGDAPMGMHGTDDVQVQFAFVVHIGGEAPLPRDQSQVFLSGGLKTGVHACSLAASRTALAMLT